VCVCVCERESEVCSSMTVIRTAMIQVWCLSVGVYGQVREGVCWCVGACGCVCDKEIERCVSPLFALL